MLKPEEIQWFHSIDIGNGISTKGVKSAADLQYQFEMFGLNADNLRGKRVLDIGCCDGYMALQCARTWTAPTTARRLTFVIETERWQ